MRQDQQRTRTPGAVAPPAFPADPIRTQQRIDAFPRPWRPAIEQLARRSSAVEDLAESFPALLFALATGYGDERSRDAALAAVQQGLSLKEAATRLGLPFWLRKLPPAAFTAPLAAVPSEPRLVGRLVSLIPQQASLAAAWLERVLIAHHTGRTDLTMWVAETYRGRQPTARSASFLGVLAWAWYSSRAGNERAQALLPTRWNATLGIARAAKEAALWKQRIALDICLSGGIADSWLDAGVIGELAFVPLLTADEMIAEAAVMDNCLDRCSERLEGRAVRIFSVRRDGRSIADIEIAAHQGEPGHPVIAQLRGPHNRRASLEVWRAAYAWLGSQPLRLADASLEIKSSRVVRTRRLEEIWRPFLDELPVAARAAMEAHVGMRTTRHRRSPRAALAEHTTPFAASA